MAQSSLWYSLPTKSMKAVLNFSSSSLVGVMRLSLFKKMASISSSVAG